jgi:hypothetical protein
VAKLPYLQFYVNDYLSDAGVRMCCIGARGLWVEMLCHMWMSPRRGYLVNASGQALGCEEIARLVGEPALIVKRLLDELMRNGVPSQDEKGAYYSRRMARDAQLSDVRRNAVSKRRDRAFEGDLYIQNGVQPSEVLQKPEARSQNSESKAAAAVVSNFPQFAAAARSIFPVDDDLLARIIAAAQAEWAPINDVDLEELVLRGVVRRDQRSPALWLKTIPDAIRSWKTRAGVA